jgi:hypothetical protein
MADRLRPLSASQAANCENAREPHCKCRCGGAGHGSKRAPEGKEDDRTWYEELPETDPHHLPSKAERKHLKRQRKRVAELRRWAAYYIEESPEAAISASQLREAEKELERIEAVVLGMRRGEAPAARVPNNQYDVWWCAKCDAEWKVPSRPHNPKCPTCGTGGWWRRFVTGPPYGIETASPILE